MNPQPDQEQMKDRATLQSDVERRSQEERRQEESCGFTCISTVGWICRRERSRRKDDPSPCWGCRDRLCNDDGFVLKPKELAGRVVFHL